jgi:hypothetical protein
MAAYKYLENVVKYKFLWRRQQSFTIILFMIKLRSDKIRKIIPTIYLIFLLTDRVNNWVNKILGTKTWRKEDIWNI